MTMASLALGLPEVNLKQRKTVRFVLLVYRPIYVVYHNRISQRYDVIGITLIMDIAHIFKTSRIEPMLLFGGGSQLTIV